MKKEREKLNVNVVAALIWQGDKFLACRRPTWKQHGGKWEFVGGKIEKGETKEDALVRECREELAISVRPIAEFLWLEYEYPEMFVEMTVFLTEIVSGEPKRLDHDELRWVGVEEMAELDFSDADQLILKKIREIYL